MNKEEFERRSLLNTVFTLLGPGRDFLLAWNNAKKLSVESVDVALSVRGIWSTIFVFNNLCKEEKFGNAALTDLHETLITDFYYAIDAVTDGGFLKLPDAFILLSAPADVCYNRLKDRDRTEEQSVKMSDMVAQVSRYEEFITWMKTKNVQVFRINTANKDPETVSDEVLVAVQEAHKNSERFKRDVCNILVDGPCGVGKSASITALQTSVEKSPLRITVTDEDVERWKETGLLGNMLEG